MAFFEKTMVINIHGRSAEIGLDDYSIKHAAGQDAALLASGKGVSEEAANRVFVNRRQDRIRSLREQRASRRGVFSWVA